MSDEIVPSGKEQKTPTPVRARVSGTVKARSLDLPLWKQGLLRAAVYGKYVILLCAIWWMLAYFELLDPVSISAGSMVLVTLMYILSLPTGLLFDVDDLIEGWLGAQEPQTKILLLIPLVLVNLMLVNVVLAYRRKGKKSKKATAETDSK